MANLDFIDFMTTRSSDSVRNLEDQLFASLRENDRLREEIKELGQRINPEADSEKERTHRFFCVVAELFSIMNHGMSTRVDVQQALRNVTCVTAPNSASLCGLCCDSPATVVFRPCNHLMACASCTQKMMSVATKKQRHDEPTRLDSTGASTESGTAGVGALFAPSVDDIVANDSKVLTALSVECPRCRTRVQETLYVYV